VNQFCTVDLGGFYLDAIKDRVYCDAADSPRRRSARATIHDLADCLIRLIAPVLPFTAEEAWEHLPGVPDESVHLQRFVAVPDCEVDEAAWRAFFELRERVNAALDQAKKDGAVGSSIAADVTVPGLDAGLGARLGEPLEQVFIVARVTPGDALRVEPAEGVKCPRCWIVGQPADPAHPVHNELCKRCFEVVAERDGH